MLKPLQPTNIASQYADMLTTQEYHPRTLIDGVRIMDLRLMQDDGGSFTEILRLDDAGNMLGIPEFKVRQSSYSLVLPGAIKAFHLHYNQEDVWFALPSDRLLIGMVDTRQDSPTCGASMRFVMGAGKAQLVYIPRGVAHGCANIGMQPAAIVYFVNQHFSLDDPDERRLPWDLLGADFWQMTPG
jgi:dTDP-4-dehydrorhamnose 3,5-epimerase